MYATLRLYTISLTSTHCGSYGFPFHFYQQLIQDFQEDLSIGPDIQKDILNHKKVVFSGFCLTKDRDNENY